MRETIQLDSGVTVIITSDTGIVVKDKCPTNVLVSTNYSYKIELPEFVELVQKLFLNGCVNISVVGKDAQELHDHIDNILEDIYLTSNRDRVKPITTTWHEDEPLEEVANLFLFYLDRSCRLYWILVDEVLDLDLIDSVFIAAQANSGDSIPN